MHSPIIKPHLPMRGCTMLSVEGCEIAQRHMCMKQSAQRLKDYAFMRGYSNASMRKNCVVEGNNAFMRRYGNVVSMMVDRNTAETTPL